MMKSFTKNEKNDAKEREIGESEESFNCFIFQKIRLTLIHDKQIDLNQFKDKNWKFYWKNAIYSPRTEH